MKNPAEFAAALALSAFIEDRVMETSKLFASDGDRNGMLFGVLRQRSRAWETPTVCSYRGCSAKSIARSHTIQRSGPLSAIAENGHVLTPQWGPDGMVMHKVGLKDASTFAGFCRRHEALFDPFEKTGIIATDRDAALQIFRSICREIARQRQDLSGLRQVHADVSARLDVEVRAEAARLGVGLTTYSFTGGALGVIDEVVADREDALRWLELAHDDHFSAVEATGPTKLVGGLAQISLALPVALSGLANFTFGRRTHRVLVSVIPQAGGSLVSMVGRKGSTKAITHYMRNQALDLCLLDIVEAWMVRGTDHWFLKPSIWAQIPEVRQTALLEEMRSIEASVAVPPSTSIFDDARRVALAVPMNPAMAPELRAFVALQRAKLIPAQPAS